MTAHLSATSDVSSEANKANRIKSTGLGGEYMYTYADSEKQIILSP